MSQLQNSPPRKIALLTPLALAAARLLSQVCHRRRQPNPLAGSGKGSSKSSIFRVRGILQLARVRRLALLLVFSSLFLPLHAETIAQKKATLSPKKEEGAHDADSLLPNVNAKLAVLRTQLKVCYEKARQLPSDDSSEEQFKQLLEQVNGIKKHIATIETKWREASVAEGKREDEGYALWDQEEVTLANLVMEYGSMEYLYIVTPDIANLKLNMHSNLPIPRESWNEMLEIVLMHNGIGVKKVNPYARQLYILKQDPSSVQAIASSARDLALLDNQARVFYVFSPAPEQIKSSFQFFEKFADAKQTFVYQIGAKIALVATRDEVEKLLLLYNAVWEDPKGKVCKVVPVSKMSVKEMEKILQSFFGEAMEKNRPPFAKNDQEGLTVLSLAQGNAVILIGQQEVVDRAEEIVNETEQQLQDPAEMTVYLYTCQHSDPSDLAKVLEKVYASLLSIPQEGGQKETVDISTHSQGPMFRTPDGYAPTPPLVVSPPPLRAGNSSQVEVDEGTDHFIPDPKTGNLLMVVRRDALVKIKELLRKLDVPKKMVQLEVLLFEKRLTNQNDFGLDLMKIGTHRNGVNFHSHIAPKPKHKGVLEFVFKQARHGHMPALNLAYTFLMTQEDVQLNVAPSVITVNQTPVMISLVEEISINNGAAPVDTNKGIAFEKSFTRAQYGIILKLTPTVHEPDEPGNENSDGRHFVTVQTDITFDTTRSNHDDRPMVDRRHIENEVRVADGESIILGGLRRKTTHDQYEKIPFFGEIPGIGKFFGSSKLNDSTTEMIFFITPKVVLDPKEELIRARTEELKKRPGDIPEYLTKLVEAQDKERRKWFRNSMKMFFGRGNDR